MSFGMKGMGGRSQTDSIHCETCRVLILVLATLGFVAGQDTNPHGIRIRDPRVIVRSYAVSICS